MSIFNTANKLTNYSVKLGDIDAIKETILTVELSYKNDTPKVLGRVILNDLYDFNLQHIWRDQKVTIFYIDIFNASVLKEFVILNINEKYDDSFNKTLVIDLQDTFSYTLEHSYISKGFNTDPVTALNSYIVDYLELDASAIDFSAFNTSYNFVVPKHINNLEWFLKEFAKHGYTFYQNKQNVLVRSLDDLLPSSLPENDPGKVFTNETNNQFYQNRIIELRTSFNQRSKILPYTRTLGYNFSTKSMDFSIDNDNSVYALSDDVFNLQESFGARDVVQQHLDFNQHIKMMKDSFNKQAELELVVNGFMKNDLNQLYDLRLKGNSGNQESQVKGNIIVNGKYVSYGITDKLIGDTLVQKIQLHRADLTKGI